MRILFIGDIVGRPGREAVQEHLPRLRQELGPDAILANGENAAGGIGIAPEQADELFDLGIDVITLGNHVWKKKEILPYLDQHDRLIRPLNFPGNPPGAGSTVITTRSGHRLGIINLQGRVFFDTHLDCPFRAAVREARKLRAETPAIVVDFHAEATSEKSALAWYLDGQVSAVLGTHTHVQTADERILPKHTAFISDVGMTGPVDSVIGIRREDVLERFLSQMPVRFRVARTGPVEFSAVMVEIDPANGRAVQIQRLRRQS